jgi:hypothetical protein
MMVRLQVNDTAACTTLACAVALTWRVDGAVTPLPTLLCADPYEAANKAHAVAIMTEWDHFKTDQMDYKRIFDGARASRRIVFSSCTRGSVVLFVPCTSVLYVMWCCCIGPSTDTRFSHRHGEAGLLFRRP